MTIELKEDLEERTQTEKDTNKQRSQTKKFVEKTEELDPKDSQEDQVEHRGRTHSPSKRPYRFGRGCTAAAIQIRTTDAKGHTADLIPEWILTYGLYSCVGVVQSCWGCQVNLQRFDLLGWVD